MQQVSKHLHQSIVYSMENREDALAYAMQFARDMACELADRFVAMWVNDLTLDYGERGRRGGPPPAAGGLRRRHHPEQGRGRLCRIRKLGRRATDTCKH